MSNGAGVEVDVKDLITVRKLIAAGVMISQGAFQKELDEILAASADLEKKYGALTDAKAAQEARAKAEGILQAEKSAAERQDQLRREEMDKLDAEKKKVADMQKELSEALDKAEQEKDKAVQLQRRLTNEAAAKNGELTERANTLAKREEELNGLSKRLDEERAALDKKSRAIREAAAA